MLLFSAYRSALSDPATDSDDLEMVYALFSTPSIGSHFY